MIKSGLTFLLVLVLMATFVVSGNTPAKALKTALKMVKSNADKLDGVKQLLVVYTDKSGLNMGNMVAFEKKNQKWVAVFGPFNAGIGRNGFAPAGEKREGDTKSPTGIYRLGRLFCYEKEIDTQMPHQQTSPDDKWIDDPESPDYNRYVQGNTSAKSYENLKISSDEYKLCMVIEYNMNPIVKGMGSAIFMHLSFGNSPNPSSGCVVITPETMEKLLKWMKPEAKPSVMMGTLKDLLTGLK